MATMKQRFAFLTMLGMATNSGVVQAIPTLQVGVPLGSGYVQNTNSSSSPTEKDTAITSGSGIDLLAVYPNKTLSIGGQYLGTGANTGINGLNWSDFGFDSTFDTHGGVLMATVPNGKLATGTLKITVDGGAWLSAFYTTAIFESGFKVPNSPSNHAPIKDQDYLFFDVGAFGNTEQVPNTQQTPPDPGTKAGEIKNLTLSATGYDWIHFDFFALVTSDTINGCTAITNKCVLATSYYATGDEGNPGSHDVTWKNPDTDTDPNPVPEPATLALLGLGLVGLGASRLKKH